VKRKKLTEKPRNDSIGGSRNTGGPRKTKHWRTAPPEICAELGRGTGDRWIAGRVLQIAAIKQEKNETQSSPESGLQSKLIKRRAHGSTRRRRLGQWRGGGRHNTKKTGEGNFYKGIAGANSSTADGRKNAVENELLSKGA